MKFNLPAWCGNSAAAFGFARHDPPARRGIRRFLQFPPGAGKEGQYLSGLGRELQAAADGQGHGCGVGDDATDAGTAKGLGDGPEAFGIIEGIEKGAALEDRGEGILVEA
jgi:hypothetical protein